MEKQIIIIALVVLLVLPIVYAGNYGAGAYDTDIYNVGEIPVTTTPPAGGGSSGGSSSSTIIYECSLDSDCNETQYCFEHKCYDAECFDDSICGEDESCWHGRCVKLFDVEIKYFESPIKRGDFFEFTYSLKGMANVSDDVEVHFWIEKDEEVITSGHDTIYIGSFEEKTKTTKLFLPSDIISGEYVFSVQLIYGTYQAKSHRTIEIQVNEGLATIGLSSEIKGYVNYMVSALIGIGAFVLFLIFYLERRKVKKAIIPEVRWIKKYRITLFTSILFIILGLLFYYLKWYEIIANWGLNIASWSKTNILPYLSSYGYYILGGIVLLVALMIFVIVARKKKLFARFKEWNEKKEKEVKVEQVKTQAIEKREKIENRENMKRFFEKNKILLSVILLLIILAGIIVYLFYSGILTAGQVGGWFRDVGNRVLSALITGYNTTADWIVGNWLYLTLGIGIVALGFILYFARKQLAQAGRWIGGAVEEHKIGFAIGLGIIILAGVIGYLFYSGILTLGGLENLLDGFVDWVKGIFNKVVSLF